MLAWQHGSCSTAQRRGELSENFLQNLSHDLLNNPVVKVHPLSEQGPAATNVPEGVYGVIDLYGQAAQATLIDLVSDYRSPMAEQAGGALMTNLAGSTIGGVEASEATSATLYREAQLNFTPEIEVFFMLFERCHTTMLVGYYDYHPVTKSPKIGTYDCSKIPFYYSRIISL